jgi:uncharacterized Zn finger protein
MSIPNLSEAVIRGQAASRAYEPGVEYYQRKTTSKVVRRGNTITAMVQGSKYAPYRVSISFDKGGIQNVQCACRHSWGGWCKHIVAALLTCLHEPQLIEERPPLEQLLLPLSREQMQGVFNHIVAQQPELSDAIDEAVAAVQKRSKADTIHKKVRRASVDPLPFKRQVTQILHTYSGGSNDQPAFTEIRSLVKKAQEFSEQGDGNNAMRILDAIISAYVADWVNLNGSSGNSGEFYTELDEALMGAILNAELTEGERAQWEETLEHWQASVAGYGIDTAFEMSAMALEQHWDDEQLLAALEGKISPAGIWEDDDRPEYAGKLANVRLKVLARQERFQEYIYLAEAEGQREQYFTMLVQVGRAEEAIKKANESMRTYDEALGLAKALREQGKLEEALQIAEMGLKLEDTYGGRLATWASELAEGLGYLERALQTRIRAFQDHPSLNHYLKAEQLAGKKQWLALKKELLSILRMKEGFNLEARVEIFLHEDLIDDAIAAVNRNGFYDTTPVLTVVDTAIKQRPDWVISKTRERAESIIDRGKSKRYEEAIAWLAKMKAAYLHSGREKEWREYKANLEYNHGRKTTLMYMLERL